jgi:hypothetical protein
MAIGIDRQKLLGGTYATVATQWEAAKTAGTK